MNPYLLTDADLCDVLRLSERAVERLRRSGALPCVVVEGHRRYRVQDVETFVAGLITPDAATDPVWQPRLLGKAKTGTA